MRSALRYRPSLNHYLPRDRPRPRGGRRTGNRLSFTGKLSRLSENRRHMHAAYFDGWRFVCLEEERAHLWRTGHIF
jgi:hypothetical protein